MGFIGLAIHLSAAAQFNYISEPSGLSPDNLQRSPPSHKHMRLRAPSRIHTHKIQFLLNNGGAEMKQKKAASLTRSADLFYFLVRAVSEIAQVSALGDSLETISYIYNF